MLCFVLKISWRYVLIELKCKFIHISNMSDKQSAKTVEKYSGTWRCNLQSSIKTKRDPTIPQVRSLSELTRTPTNSQVIGNFKYLFSSVKSREDRIKIMATDLANLWTNTLNFPHITIKSIPRKINNLLTRFENHVKRPSSDFTDNLSEIFDITDITGVWKTTEDRNFYEVQKNSRATIGFSTCKKAPLSSIHPRKRPCAIYDEILNLEITGEI